MRSYLCARDIDFASFYVFFGFWNYFDGIFLFLISLVADVIDVCFVYFLCSSSCTFVICIHLRILVTNMTSISHDVNIR